jgi:hypothetical protein
MTTGQMTVPTRGWPDFQDARVLTHNDLNGLRDYLYTKYAFQNESLFGFGVAAGLEGTVAGNALTISAGFALNGSGRELVLREPFGVNDLNDLTNGKIELTTFPFVTGPDGYTAVLCASDTRQTAGGECKPGDCTLHTDFVMEDAHVVFARGQLDRQGVFDAPVFELDPIVVSGTTITGFVDLRDALAKLLDGHLAQPTLKLLTDLKHETGSPIAVDLMQAGIVNEVLYAAWEYFRCLGYSEADPLESGNPDGVALGWLDPSGTWKWECDRRHHFVLSPALYSAMRGLRCDDLCQQYLDRIRVILETFEPPPVKQGDPPPPGKPPKPHWCRPHKLLDSACLWWREELEVPKQELEKLTWPRRRPDPLRHPVKWGDLTQPERPLGDQAVTLTPGEIAENIGLDPYAVGTMPTAQWIGLSGDGVVEQVAAALSEEGLVASIATVPMKQFNANEQGPGFRASVVVSASDSIVLGVNNQGAVMGVGVVPTAVAFQAAPGRAQAALDATQGFADRVQGLAGSVQAFETKFSGFDPAELENIQKGIGERFAEVERFVKRFERVEGDVSQLQKATAGFEVVRDIVTGQVRGGVKGPRGDVPIPRDDVPIPRGEVPIPRGDVPVKFQEAKIFADSIASLADAIESSATADRKAEVSKALARGRQAVETIRGALSGEPAAPAEVGEAFEAVLAGLRATGLSTDAPAYRAARAQVTVLQKAMGAK